MTHSHIRLVDGGPVHEVCEDPAACPMSHPEPSPQPDLVREHSSVGVCTLAPDRPRADVGLCRACVEQGLFDQLVSQPAPQTGLVGKQDELDLGPLPPRVYGPGWYVHKPTEIEAIRWASPDADEACKAFAGEVTGGGCALLIPPDVPAAMAEKYGAVGALLWVHNRQTWVPFALGDWLIREPDGRGVYPCSAAVFDDAYKPRS